MLFIENKIILGGACKKSSGHDNQDNEKFEHLGFI
jgi:hypothetical protein